MTHFQRMGFSLDKTKSDCNQLIVMEINTHINTSAHTHCANHSQLGVGMTG